MRPIAALFTFTVRQMLFSRKLWMTLLLLAAPSALIVTIRSVAPPVEDAGELWDRYHGSVQFLLVMVIIPLVCMVYGVGLIGSEVEGHTLAHLITRRMRRATVLLVKFAATALVLVVLSELALAALYACALAGYDVSSLTGAAPAHAHWSPGRDLLGYMATIPAGVVGFLAVFTLIGLLTAQPLALSVFYLIAMEVVMGNVPTGAQAYTLLHAQRVAMVYAIPELSDLFHHAEISAGLHDRLFPEGATGLPQLLGVVLAALVLSIVLVTVRELMPTKVARE